MSAGAEGTGGWRLSLTLGRAAWEALEATVVEHADAVVTEMAAAEHPDRDSPADELRVILFGTASPADDPRPRRLLGLLRQAGAGHGGAALEPVPAADWGARSLASFAPFCVGRFTVCGGHEAPPQRRFALIVDAGPAFGSGRHETTQGCLVALDRLARQRRVRVAFDVGTGSGILAMAAARLWPARIVAIDSDPAAVAAARATVRRNGLARRVRAMRGAGVRVSPSSRLGRADLICANIRARPIAAMAPAFARHLRPGGALVLSGLLATEEPLVLAAFRARRFRRRHRVRLGAWVTLILTR